MQAVSARKIKVAARGKLQNFLKTQKPKEKNLLNVLWPPAVVVVAKLEKRRRVGRLLVSLVI